MKSIVASACSAMLLALLVTNCAQNPVTGKTNFVTMSEAQEVQVGRQEDVKVRQEYGVYDNKALQQYVNEVGHVTARHSVQQVSAATAAGVGATLLQVFVPGLRNQAGDSVIGLLGNVLLSGYGREHELEADRLGAQYLARTGYDPQAMIKVVGVLKNQELFDAEVAKAEGRQPRAYHGVFASHPDSDTRLQQVVGEAGRPAPGGTRINQEEFLRKLARPLTLRVINAPRGATFADLARNSPLGNNAASHLRLVNGMYPSGEPAAGQPLKVIE